LKEIQLIKSSNCLNSLSRLNRFDGRTTTPSGGGLSPGKWRFLNEKDH
jgi:hypothetical protein